MLKPWRGNWPAEGVRWRIPWRCRLLRHGSDIPPLPHEPLDTPGHCAQGDEGGAPACWSPWGCWRWCPWAGGRHRRTRAVESRKGTLIVEINDVRSRLGFKKGKLILTGPDGKVRYTLSPSERDSEDRRGAVQDSVEGADGLRLDTPEFTLKKGGKVTVRVTVAPRAVAKKHRPRPQGRRVGAVHRRRGTGERQGDGHQGRRRPAAAKRSG